jgi:hypothetical protein
VGKPPSGCWCPWAAAARWQFPINDLSWAYREPSQGTLIALPQSALPEVAPPWEDPSQKVEPPPRPPGGPEVGPIRRLMRGLERDQQ